MSEHVLVSYTIYQNPVEYPGKVVVRRFQIRDDVVPDLEPLAVVDTIAEARALLEPNPNFDRFVRSPDDDPSIVETWLGVEQAR